MQRVRIPEDGWVLVCGEQRALFLRNLGDERAPRMKAQRMLLAAACGCCAASGEHALVRRAADAVDELCRRGEMRSLVIVAPSRTLGDLRTKLARLSMRPESAEIAGELTDRPIHRIEVLLSAP